MFVHSNLIFISHSEFGFHCILICGLFQIKAYNQACILINKLANTSLPSSSLQFWPMVLSMQLFLHLAGCAIRDSRHLPLLLQSPSDSPGTTKINYSYIQYSQTVILIFCYTKSKL